MIALVTQADWCSVCKANGSRAGAAVMKGARDVGYEVVINDVSNEATQAKSKPALQDKGLAEIAGASSPGTIQFIDAKSHKRVAEITVAHQDQEIVAAATMARKRITN